MEGIILPPPQREDKVAAGQRRINMIWEVTQAVMTVAIVGANVFAMFRPPADETARATMTNAMFVVLGFYYGRTNHVKIGGVPQGR